MNFHFTQAKTIEWCRHLNRKEAQRGIDSTCTPTAISTYQTEQQSDTSTKADTGELTFCFRGGGGNGRF